MKKLKFEVFFPPFFLLLLCVIVNLADSELFSGIVGGVNAFITEKFGWMIILLSVVIFVVCVAMFFSDFGKVTIGGPSAKPTMSLSEWFSINICTTIACGIIFWSAAEPVQHLMYPPSGMGIKAMTPEAAKFAMSAIFTHWTVLPYGIYTIAAVMFAFGYYNKKGSFSLGTMVTVLTGGQEYKWLNTVIDSICLFTLAAGLAGSLGVGVLNLSGGLYHLLGIGSSPSVWIVLMAVIAGTVLLSAISGIMKGVRRLSNLNVYIYFFIVIFVFLFGESRFICSFATESLGEYISGFFGRSLYTGTFETDHWAGSWPVFYMSSWMAWAPITAVFLGRIAYGRKIRELITMNLLAASLFSVIWFSVLSGSTIHFTLNVADSGIAEAFEAGIENTIYQLFANMPAAGLLTVIFLAAVFLSLVTAADSTTIAMADLSANGIQPESPDSPNWIKAVWVVLMAAVAMIMMGVGNGADGLKMITNIGGLPAAVFLIFVVTGGIKILFRPDTYKEET